MYTLSLEIINKCNLNCTYCYLGEKKNTYMSLETAQKAIDIAVHEANKQYDRTLMVYFIGGEPLMAFNLMKDAVGYTKKKCQETNLICKFSTTINGPLVTDEIIDFFVENTFEVKVSLDGQFLILVFLYLSQARIGNSLHNIDSYYLLRHWL